MASRTFTDPVMFAIGWSFIGNCAVAIGSTTMMTEVSKPAAKIYVTRLFLLVFNKLTIKLMSRSFCYNPCLHMIRNKVPHRLVCVMKSISCEMSLECLSAGLGKALMDIKRHAIRPYV